MDPTGVLNNLTLKLSFRQPPSIKALNNMNASTQKNQLPVKCSRKCCLICAKVLCTDKKVEVLTGDNNFETINAARFSCKTRNLVYVLFDKNTREVYYVGHTGQSLETRIYQHTGGKKLKGGNSKFRDGLLDDQRRHLEVQKGTVEVRRPEAGKKRRKISGRLPAILSFWRQSWG